MTQSFVQRFATIHFAWGGNDFIGGLFLLDAESLASPVEISLWSDTILCTKKLRWLYYNMQRGQKLWPLDEQTNAWLFWGYTNLIVDGGLYTTCSFTWSVGWTLTVDPFDIVGHIRYDHPDYGVSEISAGKKYTRFSNTDDGIYASSLGMFNNETIVGFLFDTYGGIWFVGGYDDGICYDDLLDEFNTTSGTVNTAFSLSWDLIVRETTQVACSGWILTWNGATNLLWNVDIKWLAWVSDAISTQDRQSLVGNIGEQSLLRNTDFVTASALLSLARKNARMLCRGKEPFVWSSLTWIPIGEDVLCIDSGWGPFVIDLDADASLYENKTLIIKEWDVLFQWSMPYDSLGMNLFIEKGNLLLENVIDANDLTFFDWFGFPESVFSTTRGLYIRANLVINGIIAWVDNATTSPVVGYHHKVFLHGRLSSLSTPLEPTIQRKRQLENLFWVSRLTSFWPYINIQQAIERRCGTDGLGNDWFVECDALSDDHALASLIVIPTTDFSLLLDDN